MNLFSLAIAECTPWKLKIYENNNIQIKQSKFPYRNKEENWELRPNSIQKLYCSACTSL
jgi:hypothetical protein